METTLPSSWYLEDDIYVPMEDLTLDIRKYVTERIGPHLGK